MRRTYGIGVLGLGTIGRLIADELSDSERFEVVAAFDPAPPSETPYPLRASAEEVCADPRVDCVYIASPPRWHRQGVELAIRYGKAILCEKPLAPTVADAERLAADVATAGLPNVVNFAFQTLSTGRALQTAVRQGLLGDVEVAEVRVGVAAWPQRWHAQAGTWLTTADEGGFTREVLTHFMALADQLFGTGTVEGADVVRGQDGLETSVTAGIRYGPVQLSVRAGLDPTIRSDDDLTSRFSVQCQQGEMAIEDWLKPIGIPVTDPRPGGIAHALALHLDGAPSDLQDFAAGARVARVIEGILAHPSTASASERAAL